MASNSTLIVTDIVTTQLKRKLGQNHHTGRVNCIASTKFGEAYVTGSYDKTVAIWDGRSHNNKPLQVLKDATDSVTDVHVSQYGNSGQEGARKNDSNSNNNNNVSIIRTASVDGCIRTYDLRAGLLQCDDFGSPITSTAHTKDGRCLAVSCLDGSIRLMELGTGNLLNTYNSHHTAGSYGLQVDVLGDDSSIITGSEDGKCAIYDLVTSNLVGSLNTNREDTTSHRRPTCTVAAHPQQSSVVITASYDGSTVAWRDSASSWREQVVA